MASIIRIRGCNPAWQFRTIGRKYSSKYFSDSHYGGSSGALFAATNYMQDYLEKNPEVRIPYRRKLQSNNTSGIVGVYRTNTVWRGKQVYYWAAFCPIGPNGQLNSWAKRFYIHKYGESLAKFFAIGFRKKWEVAAESGNLTEFFLEEGY